MRTVREIQEDIAAKTREINPLAVRYVEGGLEGDDLATFRRLHGELETLHGELADAKRAEEDAQRDRAAAQRMIDDHRHYNQPAGGSAARQVPGDTTQQRGEGQPAGRTMGERFVNSEQFRQYRDHGVGRGGSSAPFNAGDLMEQRALVTSTVVTEMILPDRRPGIYAPELRELTLRQALPNGRTNSNLVEYVREASRTNNAAEVAEATSLSDGAKPESGFTLESASAPVRTIATLMYVTRAALDDMAGLQSYIDELLRRFIDERVDRQLLIGNGVAPNLEGLNEVSGVLNLNGAYWAANGGITNKADRIRRAITRIRLAGRGRASLAVLNPADVEYFELLKTSEETGVTNNAYALPGGGPFGPQAGVPTIWGRPIVEHEDQTAGIATVLDSRAAMVMDRMDTQLFITDSNRDLFERNILTILAETRLAFPIFFPSRIALVDLEATS
jgi:HK97 family phage major capsid protein